MGCFKVTSCNKVNITYPPCPIRGPYQLSKLNQNPLSIHPGWSHVPVVSVLSSSDYF